MGIHWYHCNPTFLWKIIFTLVRRLISALIWDIFGLWNSSDGRDYREKQIVISRFLAPYIFHILFAKRSGVGIQLFTLRNMTLLNISPEVVKSAKLSLSRRKIYLFATNLQKYLELVNQEPHLWGPSRANSWSQSPNIRLGPYFWSLSPIRLLLIYDWIWCVFSQIV